MTKAKTMRALWRLGWLRGKRSACIGHLDARGEWDRVIGPVYWLRKRMVDR